MEALPERPPSAPLDSRRRSADKVRRGRAGPGGRGPRETGVVERTPPHCGHAPAETPAGATIAAERRTKTKRAGRLRARLDGGGAARTQRTRLPAKAPTTGAAHRALALELGRFLYAYRRGHTVRCRDATRSLKNRMETITSMPQTGEGAAFSLRTSRKAPHRPDSLRRTGPSRGATFLCLITVFVPNLKLLPRNERLFDCRQRGLR